VNPADPNETVIELYLAGCTELFATYGLTSRLERVESVRGRRRGTSYVSVLSAVGDLLTLSSTVDIDARLLRELHPATATRTRIPRRDLEDWCRELNNQLVGRMKNKLLRHGCEVTAGLPVLMTGSRIDVLGLPSQDVRRYFFATEQGCLALTLAVVMLPGTELQELQSLPDGEEIRSEGMLALF
jgi:hypothetical protein